MSSEDEGRPSNGLHSLAQLDGPTLVRPPEESSEGRLGVPKTAQQPHQNGDRSVRRKVTPQRVDSFSSHMLQKVNDLNLTKNSLELYVSSWRPKTRRQYSVYLRRWCTLCVIKNWDKNSPRLREAIFFLSQMFENGMSYSAINSARCTLSSVLNMFDGVPFGQHPVVVGIYNKRPQLSRYGSTWDIDVVLQYLRELSPLKDLSLRELSAKCVMLLLLITAQRVQTLSTLKIRDMCWSSDKSTVVFRLSQVLKHSKRGSLGTISLSAFPQDPRICVVKTLRAYLAKTSEIRDEVNGPLLISTKPPFQPASTTTIARWTKETLANAGIDVSLFKAHSVRGATTSKMSDLRIPVQEIMKKAAWKSESTFQKFYKKPLLPVDVSHQVLSSFVNRRT